MIFSKFVWNLLKITLKISRIRIGVMFHLNFPKIIENFIEIIQDSLKTVSFKIFPEKCKFPLNSFTILMKYFQNFVLTNEMYNFF